MDEYQPLSRNCTIEDLLRVQAAANWLAGFVLGAGRELPEAVAMAVDKLSDWTR
jgi:hypothetical protein